MVLGLFRRKKGGNPPAAGETKTIGPKGSFDGRCYSPAPGEVESAELLPAMLSWSDPREVLSEEEFGWVLVGRNEWRPRGRSGVKAYVMCNEVKLEGYPLPFTAIAWTPEGRTLLLDDTSYILLGKSLGDKTASEIVEEVIAKFIEKLPPDFPVKAAMMKEEKNDDDRDLVHGFIAAFYAQLAILRKYGLIT